MKKLVEIIGALMAEVGLAIIMLVAVIYMVLTPWRMTW